MNHLDSKNYTNLEEQIHRSKDSLSTITFIKLIEEQLVRWIKDEKIKSVERCGFMSMPEGLAQLYDGSNRDQHSAKLDITLTQIEISQSLK